MSPRLEEGSEGYVWLREATTPIEVPAAVRLARLRRRSWACIFGQNGHVGLVVMCGWCINLKINYISCIVAGARPPAIAPPGTTC